ncbi:MAG: MBL fold metallo-hydrolase [Candidatus Riflebacteria bacterium]|nr:MBL fold metallo-hydrolase [Candidatus Riflebacteria bacterium]
MLLGKYSIDILNEGSMLVDGGIAFAGIEKEEWSKFATPDEKNRIRLGVNQVLIRGADVNILIDAGLGTKIRENKRKIMGLSDSVTMTEKLANLGLTTDDITHVVFSHLHFDHCAGVTEISGNDIIPVFANAVFVIQGEEWQSAVAPDEISKSSYALKDFLPLQQTGRLKLVNGNIEIADGIFLEVTGGHTKGHQIVRVEDEKDNFIYIGDICPTPFHLDFDRHEAFDLYPLNTIFARKRLLRYASKKNSIIAFPHDLEGNLYRIVEIENVYKAVKA